MSIILTDIASVLSLVKISQSNANVSDNINNDILQMVQNIILCDSIIIDKEAAKYWGVLNTCNLYEGVFNYVESFALSKDNDISRELSLLRRPHDNSLRIGSGKQKAFILGAINYLNIASKLNVYYCPHSYRDKLVNALLNYNNIQISEKAISYFEKRLSETSAFNLAGIDLKVPAVAEYALNFAEKNKCDLPTAVNEIRNWKSAQKFRAWCKKMDEELSSSSKRSSYQTFQKMASDIDKAISKWGSDLDDGVKYFKRQISLRKIWGVGNILSIFGLDKIEIKDPVINSRRYENLIFLNDIYRQPPIRYMNE